MWFQPLGWEDSPGGGNGNPFQYSCLENPMDKGAWQAIQSMGSQSTWGPTENQPEKVKHAPLINHTDGPLPLGLPPAS